MNSVDANSLNPDTTHLLIRQNDVALKGKNRPDFEKLLEKSLLRSLPETDSIQRVSGRVVIRLTPTGRDSESVLSRISKISKIPGIAAVTPCRVLETSGFSEPQMSEVLHWVKNDLNSDPSISTFAARVRRVEITGSGTSIELERKIGAAMLGAFPRLKVSLKQPNYTIRIEVRRKHVLIHSHEAEGQRGLPLNPVDRVVCLMSGGIDSPVAVHEVMRRGLTPILVHFHSIPYTSQASVEKVKKLVGLLRSYSTVPIELWMVPFAEIQKTVRDTCTERFRTVHYRRMMMRLAEEVAIKRGALALVTGEAIGQVASQTLRNLRSIDDAVSMPVLRPLITLDKDKIVKKAKEIGTFETSVEPHEDTCVLFAPAHPATQANLLALREEELRIPAFQLIFSALDSAERILV